MKFGLFEHSTKSTSIFAKINVCFYPGTVVVVAAAAVVAVVVVVAAAVVAVVVVALVIFLKFGLFERSTKSMSIFAKIYVCFCPGTVVIAAVVVVVVAAVIAAAVAAAVVAAVVVALVIFF